MKVIQFEGTPDEFKVVAYLFNGPATVPAVTLTASPEVKDLSESTNEAVSPPITVSPVEAVRALLRRLPPSEGQMKLFRALKDGPVAKEDLLEATGWSPAELRGTMGALGKRVNGTPEVHAAGLPTDSDAVIESTRNGGSWIYALRSHAREALAVEELI